MVAPPQVISGPRQTRPPRCTLLNCLQKGLRSQKVTWLVARRDPPDNYALRFLGLMRHEKLCQVPSSVIAKHVDGEWGRLWLVRCLDVFEGAFFCRGCNVNFNWSRSQTDMGFFLVLQRLFGLFASGCRVDLVFGMLLSPLVSRDLSIPTCKGQLQGWREFSSFHFILSLCFPFNVSFSFSFFKVILLRSIVPQILLNIIPMDSTNKRECKTNWVSSVKT